MEGRDPPRGLFPSVRDESSEYTKFTHHTLPTYHSKRDMVATIPFCILSRDIVLTQKLLNVSGYGWGPRPEHGVQLPDIPGLLLASHTRRDLSLAKETYFTTTEKNHGPTSLVLVNPLKLGIITQGWTTQQPQLPGIPGKFGRRKFSTHSLLTDQILLSALSGPDYGPRSVLGKRYTKCRLW